jgi:hypothetical protein
MTDPGERRPSDTSPSADWSRAFTRVAIVALLMFAALYVFRSLLDLPGDAVDKGREVVAELGSLASAFASGTVETTFAGYGPEVTGTSRLQFATFEQTEVWRREDSSSLFWGTLALPDVAVSATAPVTYTYYLDFDDPWRFTLSDDGLRVVAPRIRFNEPAIDASRIRYEVLDSSVLRDEDEALEELKRGLTLAARMRARRHVALVREEGRRQTGEFVGTWLQNAFGDGGEVPVEVVFADEISDAVVDRAFDE